MPRGICRALVVVATIGLIAFVVAAATETSRIVMFLPPFGALGQEFFPVLEVFEEHGVSVDVVAPEVGPYPFWEDSGEGVSSGAIGGYEWEIQMTFDDVDLSDYDVLIMGPGFAHTFWAGESLPKAEALLQEAYDAGMPIGGVTYGAMFLIQNGYLDGRTTARPPLYQGVVSEELHRTRYLITWAAVNYGTECIHVDYGVGGVSTIITANYRCVTGFARKIITEFLTD